MHEQVIGSGDFAFDSIDIRRRKQGVGPRSHDDTILRGIIYGDKRHARSNAIAAYDIGRIDTFAGIMPHGFRSEPVVAHAGDKADVASHTGRSDRLIGALAACIDHKIRSDKRLSGRGNTRRTDNQIGIGTSYYNNFSHNYILLTFIFRASFLPRHSRRQIRICACSLSSTARTFVRSASRNRW